MFSNDELKQLIAGKVIGNMYPYSTDNENELEHYLKRLAAQLKRERIHLYEEPAHFGSGYASYIQWLCYEDKHVTTTENDSTRTVKIEGIAVLISRLTPVVLIGRANMSETSSLDGNTLGRSSSVFATPSDLQIETEFMQLAQRLQQLFMQYQFSVLTYDDVVKPLPFDTDIETVFRKKRDYLVWDAIFYWTD